MKRIQIGIVTACFFVAVLPANAGLIANGGFESGFSNWTRVQQPGSAGDFLLQTGTTTPILGMTVPPPPEGTTAAMTDAEGPGSYVLYQNFVVPVDVGTAFLNFSLLIRNSANAFVTPETLDYFTPAQNQQFRVDIVSTTADVFSVAPGDVLFNAYRTEVGSPLSSGYSTFAIDISSLLQANAGNTLRLRFSQADNINIFNAGVDQVDIDASPIPEPAGWTLMSGGLLMVGLLARRSRS